MPEKKAIFSSCFGVRSLLLTSFFYPSLFLALTLSSVPPGEILRSETGRAIGFPLFSRNVPRCRNYLQRINYSSTAAPSSNIVQIKIHKSLSLSGADVLCVWALAFGVRSLISFPASSPASPNLPGTFPASRAAAGRSWHDR